MITALACLAALSAPPATTTNILVEAHTVDGSPVVVVRPEVDGPLPVVYALAGLGEMVRGPKASAWGWVEKYGLEPAMRAVHRGALTEGDFQGLVTGSALEAYQAPARSYRGVVVVCPAASRRYEKRFVRHLLQGVVPWAEKTLPILRGARHRGIDGISLGGRHALLIARDHPAEFRAVGTEQAAVKGLWRRYQRSLTNNPRSLAHLEFNLLTSERDPFRPAIAQFAARLRSAGLRVRHQVTRGRHDKRFAKGPGVIDMLLFHDRALR